MKYRKCDYIGYDPFDGEYDVDLRCRSVKLPGLKEQFLKENGVGGIAAFRAWTRGSKKLD